MAGGVPFTPLYERYDILPNGCWQWNSSLSPRGYPRFTVRDKTFPAHRFFYEFYHSTKIPTDMALDHLCKNTACVNPQHLEVVTSGVNTRRAILKTECKRGHPLSGDNLYLSPNGNRQCRACNQLNKSYRSRYDRW